VAETRAGTGVRRAGSISLTAVVVIGALLPVATLALRAAADEWRAPALLPQRYGSRGVVEAFADTPRTAEAIMNSLGVAVTTTLVALLLAWPAARVLGERRLRRPAVVWVLLGLPVIVPSFATGSGLAEWFLRLGLADTLAGLVIAHLVVVLPYVVLILASGFGPEVSELEEAAAVSGLGTLRRLRLATLPALAPVLAVAALMGFLVSWSQYGLSLAVGGGTPMLPLELVPFIGADPQVAAVLALVFLAPAVTAVVVALHLARRAGVPSRQGHDVVEPVSTLAEVR
jgi:putative spermidine/putrescine transport system permease protein